MLLEGIQLQGEDGKEKALTYDEQKQIELNKQKKELINLKHRTINIQKIQH